MARKIEALSVDVNGDIHGLAKAMNDAVALLNNTKKAVKEVNKAIESGPNDINHLKNKLDIYNQLVERNREARRELEKQAEYLKRQENFGKNTFLSKEYQSLIARIEQCNKEEKDFNEEIERTKLLISNFTFNQKFKKLNEELAKTEKTLGKVRESLGDVDKKIELDPSNISLYQEKHRLLAEALELSNKRMDELKKKRDLLSSSNFHKVTEQDREELEKVNKEIEKETENIAKLNSALSRSASMDMFLDNCEALGNALEVVANRTRRFSQAMKTLLGTAFSSSVSYESGIANIKKVVKDLSDETIEDLKDIAIETGNTFDKVSEYATIAGALGLTNEELAKFSKSMLDLNAVSNGAFSGEEGAKDIAVFLKQLNLGIDQVENFGSAIAVIGDKYADIGSETVDVATRLTGLNSIVKTNQYELLGLAGVMSDLGLSTSSNANAINRSFLQIDKILSGGVKDWESKLESIATTAGMSANEFRHAWGESAIDSFLKFTDGLRSSVFNDINKAIQTSDAEVLKFADILGLSADQFKRAWNDDSIGIFNKYVEALGELGEEGESASSSLASAGLSSVFVAQTLLRLSGNGNRVREAIELANDAWNENIALNEKTNILYETTERKIEAFKESWNQLSASFVDVFLPAIKNVIDGLTNIFKSLRDGDPAVKGFVTTFVMLGATLSPTAKAFSVLLTSIGKLNTPFEKLDKSTQMLIRGFNTIPGKALAVGGAVALVTTAFVAGTVALGKYLDKNDTFSKKLSNVRDGLYKTSEAFDEIKTSLSNLMVEYDYQLALYDKNIEKVQGLIKTLEDEKLTDEEIVEKRKEIADSLDKINQQLGTSYSYDEKANAIKNEQGDVADLIKSYEDLILEKRKAYFLEESMGAYNDALKNQKEAYEAIAEAKWEYARATKDVDESLVAFSQAYAKNPMSQEVLKVFDQLDYDTKAMVVNLADAYLKAKGIIDESDKLVTDSQNLINNVEGVAGAQGDVLEHYLDLMKDGFNIDPAKNDLDQMKEKLEKINYLLSNPEGLSMETLLGLEEQKTNLEQQIEATETALQKATELGSLKKQMHEDELGYYDANKQKFLETNQSDSDSILNTSNMTWQQIVSNVSEATSSIAEDYKTKVSNANSEAQGFLSSNPLHQTVLVTYQGLRSGGSLGGGLGGGGPYLPNGSGGFGDIYRAMLDSVRNSMQSPAFHSGGYSKSFVVNANFNVNSNNIDRSVVRAWSSWIVDDLNELLGKQM